MARTYDCLIIGYNDLNFGEYVNILKSMGTDHVDYRDLNLNYIEYKGKPYRAADILTHFYYEGREKTGKPFHNSDLLWMTILYLGTYLSRRGFTFDYINLFHFEKDKLKEKLERNVYLTVAITTTIYNFEHPVLEIISFIRRYNRTARVIVGGPYISKRAERLKKQELQSFFKYMGADFYVSSREGESALVDILNAIKNRGDFSKIDNIAYRDNDGFAITPLAQELNPLEENMIDYSLFPREEVGPFVNLKYSKGCPYKCAFCGFPLRSSKFLYTGVGHIKKELDALRDLGTVTHIHFTDDTVNVPKKRFKEIMRMMIAEKYGFKWNCYFRCDRMDEETATLMKEAGCEGVFLGLESANETILRNMNKNSFKQDYRRAIPWFKQAGIMTFISIFAGFPGETPETFRETLDFLVELKADFYRPQLWYCDTLTPIWQQREKFGLKGNHFSWSHNTMDARTACDLLEQAMLTVDTPVWVPDPGYNYITIYMLRQRGMSFEKQKRFLRCFNAVVREKLLYPGKKEISPGLLESLKRSCRFDEPGEPDMRPVHMLADVRYLAAQDFWKKQFAKPVPGPGKRASATAGSEADVAVSGPVEIERALVNRLQSSFDVDITDIFSAAYSTLLLRVTGHEDIPFVMSPDEKEPFPLRLYPKWNMSFGQLVREARENLSQSLSHRVFAFHVLTGPPVKVENRNRHGIFETAYLVTDREPGPGQWENDFAERLKHYPAVRQNVSLLLQLIKHENSVRFRFRYDGSVYSPDTIEKYGTYLTAILAEAGRDPDIRLKEILPAPGAEKLKQTVKTYAQQSFHF